MAVRNLTEKMVERISNQTVGQSRQRIFDGSFPGLVLDIGAKSKTFFWKGQSLTGKTIKVKIGRYPLVSLEQAREECIKFAGLVRKGIDPRGHSEGLTGDQLVDELTTHATWKFDRSVGRADTLEKYLRAGFVDTCGDMQVTEIHSGHLLDIIESYQKNGRMAASSHMWCALSILWKFAILRRYVGINPMYGISSPKANQPRDRILSDDELVRIWNALGNVPQQPVEHSLCIRLLMLLPFRGCELIGAEWSEIDFEKANWVVPRERVKTRSSGSGLFLMPLPPMATQLLEMLHELNGKQRFLFPQPRAKNGPIDVRVIGRFISRNRENGIFKGMQCWTKHDLRRTIATNMGALKVDEGIIGRCLNHRQPGVTSKCYNLYGYRDEKYAALKLWEDDLMRIVNQPARASGRAI